MLPVRIYCHLTHTHPHTHVHAHTPHRTTRLASFPDYLMIQMVKFSFAEDWVPKKFGKLSLPSLTLAVQNISTP